MKALQMIGAALCVTVFIVGYAMMVVALFVL